MSVPVKLLNDLRLVSDKVKAYMKSDGDATVMASFTEVPSITTLVLITGFLLLFAYIITEIANYNEIKQNWAHYQCMPTIAPFAEFYGHDLKATMSFCVAQSVKEHAPGVINPIYKGISEVTDVVEGVFDKIVSIEGGVVGLLKGFDSFVLNFLNSFRLIGTRIRVSIIHIKDIFGRVYGLFIAFVYAGISALTFGQNLVCNPLVTFIAGLSGHEEMCCFAPATRVAMEDGTVTAIRDLQVGDVLAGGAVVGSTYRFTGIHSPMVRIEGVEVSTKHYVRYKDRLIHAGKHPGAIPVFRLPYLWCIATSDHRIPIVGDKGILEFADYEESSDPAVIAEAQRIAETVLNNGAVVGDTVPDYSLGLDPTLLVYMRNGSWIPIGNVDVGDQLMSGAFVVGVIRERCETLCLSDSSSIFSAAQLIHYEGVWRRAAHIWPPTSASGPAILTHLLTDGDAPITVRSGSDTLNVRDYAEITGTQAPYDTKLNAQSPT